MLQNVLRNNKEFIFGIHVLTWVLLRCLSVAMGGKNMDNEPKSTMLSTHPNPHPKALACPSYPKNVAN
jgi:hypothetical protein